MASETETVTLRDIALLAGGVTAPAVANWRKRFDDFPQPIGKEGRQPLFDREDVIAWLTANGKAVDPTNTDDSLLAAVANLLRQTSDLDAVTQLGLTLNDPDFEYGTTPVHGRFSDEIRRLRTQFTSNEVLTAVIDRLVHSAGRRFDEYRAPKNFSALIATISETPEDAVLYDPCAGLGSTLAAAATSTSALHGQELVPEIAAAARQLLASRNLHANIVQGDTIREDKLTNVIADRVFAVPPLNMRLDEGAVNDNDPRWTLRTPKKYESDVAFIQIALAHLGPAGRAVVHTSLSVLHRTNSILETIVRNNQLDAVITLPAGVAPGANVESCLLVIDKQRPTNTIERQTPILMVDINDNEDVRYDISETFLNQMTDLWDAWNHTPVETSIARTVTIAEIQQNDFNLSPARYVKQGNWPRSLESLNDPDNENGAAFWDSEFSLAYFVEEIAQEPGPSLDREAFKLSKPATLTPLSQLRKQKIIEVIRGDANPNSAGDDSIITSINQLAAAPDSQPSAATTSEEVRTRPGDVIVAIRQDRERASERQGIRIDDEAWRKIPRFGEGSDPEHYRDVLWKTITADSAQSRIGRINDDWSGRQLSRDFLIIRVSDEAALSNGFLYFWLATPAFSAHVERLSRSGAASRIGTKDLLSFELPLIEKDQQAAVLSSLVRLRKKLARVHQTARNILGWAETFDELSVEYLAASLLEEPGYSIAVEEERQQRRSSLSHDPCPEESVDE